MYSAFIFDFDGVLFDSEHLHLQACNEVFKNYNIFIDEKYYFNKYSGLSDKEIFPIVFTDHGQDINNQLLKKLLQEKLLHYKKIINHESFLSSRSGMIHFLKKINKSNKKIAICSNAMLEEVELVLQKLESGEIKKYFSTITTIESVDKGKPDPTSYLQTSHKLGILPKECIVLEDTPSGIKAAKSADMFVIGITGTHDKKKLIEADLIVNRLEEIPESLFQ